jgi:hypothetical protein
MKKQSLSEPEPFFPRILNLDFGLSIFPHHTFYSSFNIPGVQESRRGKKKKSHPPSGIAPSQPAESLAGQGSE